MLRHRRPLILAVLAFALFVRALVPAGWMPAPNGGLFAIEPCPAAAALPLLEAGRHHHGNHGSGHGAAHDGDCAFGSLLTNAAPSAIPALAPAPAVVADAIARSSAAPVLKTGPPALPPPATGPPAIV
jgi:hypothetical protein